MAINGKVEVESTHSGSNDGLPPTHHEDCALPEDERDDAAAEAAKDRGNTLFKEAHFSAAEQEYTSAIAHSTLSNPNLPAFYTNRAFCHIKLENFGSAIIDAEKALELKPGFRKAYYRRGCAQACLTHWKDALKDFQIVVKLAGPQGDADAADKVKQCQKEIRAQKFAAAIESDRSKLASETVNIDEMCVSSSYDGPVWPNAEAAMNDIPDVEASDRKKQEYYQSVLDYIKTPGQKLATKYMYKVVMDVITLLKELPTLVRIPLEKDAPFTICGDVHGQFYDLLNIFRINGYPSTINPYLFNGDFVDRGSFSVEVMVALFVARLLWPQTFHLARGNHEAQSMNRLYGFHGEVVAKYDARLYDLFTEAFNFLPLAHVIDGRILVVHGGLFSKDGVTLADIEAIDRNHEPADDGLMVELLWSDPQPFPGRAPSKRGTGVAFGPDVTKRFLDANNLQMLVRSHEVKEEGYEVECDGRLVTIFSAPNYCDNTGNKGAVMTFRGGVKDPKYTQFDAVPHPPVRPMQYASNALLSMGLQ